MTNLDSVLKSRDITLPTMVRTVKALVFPIVMLWMWELNNKKGWALKNLCLWTVVLEKTYERLLNTKVIKPVNPKGNWPWIFIGRTDAEAEVPLLWPPNVKSWLTEKDPNAGNNWRQEEKGTTEDEMVGWHHWLDGHEFWANSKGWWRTGKPVVLPSMRSQRVNVTEWLNNNYVPTKNKKYSKPGQDYCILIKERTSDLCKIAADHRRQNTN